MRNNFEALVRSLSIWSIVEQNWLKMSPYGRFCKTYYFEENFVFSHSRLLDFRIILFIQKLCSFVFSIQSEFDFCKQNVIFCNHSRFTNKKMKQSLLSAKDSVACIHAAELKQSSILINDKIRTNWIAAAIFSYFLAQSRSIW